MYSFSSSPYFNNVQQTPEAKHDSIFFFVAKWKNRIEQFGNCEQTVLKFSRVHAVLHAYISSRVDSDTNDSKIECYAQNTYNRFLFALFWCLLFFFVFSTFIVILFSLALAFPVYVDGPSHTHTAKTEFKLNGFKMMKTDETHISYRIECMSVYVYIYECRQATKHWEWWATLGAVRTFLFDFDSIQLLVVVRCVVLPFFLALVYVSYACTANRHT